MQRPSENHKAMTETELKALGRLFRPTLFTLLPTDLSLLVTSQLPCSGTRRLAYFFPSIFTHARLKPVSLRAAETVHQFFVHVMEAKLEVAKEMLAKDPSLILEGHSIGEHQCVPALLLAKRMGDIAMCKMLLEHLQAYDAHCSERLNRKVNHTSAQIKYVAADSHKKAPLDVNIFGVVADAIAAHPADAEAELTRLTRKFTAVETKLSAHMDACRSAIDQHGECSAEDMANVFDALVRNADKFKSLQRDLFFLHVVAHVVDKLRGSLKRDINDGILDMLRKHKMVDPDARPPHYAMIPREFFAFAQTSPLSYEFFSDFYELWLGKVSLWATVRDGFQKFSRETESALVGLKLMQPGSEPEPENVKRFGYTIC